MEPWPKSSSGRSHTMVASPPMQDQIAALQARLREKEQLVAALTERLEQAAEQLDRVHRTGADRAVRTGGVLPPELIEQQKQLTEDLQRAVQAWEDMQAAVALGRIEVQVTELRDLVATSLETGSTTAVARDARSGSPNGVPRGQTASPLPETTADGWEALKASLLAGEAAAPAAPSDAAETAEPVLTAAGTAEGGTAEGGASETQTERLHALASDEHGDEEVVAPQPVDFAHATREDLEQAIEQRDQYIACLSKRLRAASSHRGLPEDWEALQNVPDELRSRLQELESRLQENLRLAEVELSLERARLGREEARLRLVEEQLQKETRRMGLLKGSQRAEEKSDAASGAEADPKSRRWMRMLGMSQGDSPP